MLRFTTPYCIYRWTSMCTTYETACATITNKISNIHWGVYVYVHVYSVDCQLINKCLFVYLFVCLFSYSLRSDFQSVRMFHCFVSLSIRSPDLIQTHKEIECTHSTRRLFFVKWKVYMEFQMNFYSLSSPFFRFIIHSHGISQIPTNLRCV